MPGGGLETDDYASLPKTTKDHWYFAIEKSLRREIKEEVNLEVGKINYLLDMTHISKGVPSIILSFYCKHKSGKVKLDEDSVDYKWISVKDLKKYDIIEGIPEEILMVDSIIKTGKAGKIEKKLRK